MILNLPEVAEYTGVDEHLIPAMIKLGGFPPPTTASKLWKEWDVDTWMETNRFVFPAPDIDPDYESKPEPLPVSCLSTDQKFMGWRVCPPSVDKPTWRLRKRFPDCERIFVFDGTEKGAKKVLALKGFMPGVSAEKRMPKKQSVPRPPRPPITRSEVEKASIISRAKQDTEQRFFLNDIFHALMGNICDAPTGFLRLKEGKEMVKSLRLPGFEPVVVIQKAKNGDKGTYAVYEIASAYIDFLDMRASK